MGALRGMSMDRVRNREIPIPGILYRRLLKDLKVGGGGKRPLKEFLLCLVVAGHTARAGRDDDVRARPTSISVIALRY